MTKEAVSPAEAAGILWKRHTDIVRLEVSVVGVTSEVDDAGKPVKVEMGSILTDGPRTFKANKDGLSSLGFNVNGKVVDPTATATAAGSKGFQVSANVVAVKSREWAQ